MPQNYINLKQPMKCKMTITIEIAKPSDLPAVNSIYNYYIQQTSATFDTEPWELNRRTEWFKQFSGDSISEQLYHFFVAKQEGQVVGFVYNSPFREKAAFNIASEVTIYLSPYQTSKGLGSLLYQQLFTCLSSTSLSRFYAFITVPNDASVALHKKFDFKEVGFMHHVGMKFGDFHSVALYEKQVIA